MIIIFTYILFRPYTDEFNYHRAFLKSPQNTEYMV
jgi:hypothetical protein